MIARAALHPWLTWRQMQDITINLYHMMDFGNRRFTARIANTGEIIHTMDEFALVAAGVQKL